MTTPDAPSIRSTRVLLAICFFLSGAAGLVYELLWSRYLNLLFGSTTESVAVVLAAFMGGLGLGAHLLGRRVDRSPSPMRLYGMFEIGIGLFAIATGPLLAIARAVYHGLAHDLQPDGVAATLLKLVLSALVLVPPATLMGGTLPALVRAVSDSGAAARVQIGVLYAVNTLGAVAGTLACGFVLIEVLGLEDAMRLTAVLNLGIGGLVIVRSRRGVAATAASGVAGAAASVVAGTAASVDAGARPSTLRTLAATAPGRYALVGLFFSGVTTMIYELVFTRVLGVVFGVSSYAFTVVLAVFLTGLGLGAVAAYRLVRARAPRSSDFGLAQLALAVVVAVALVLVPFVPRLVMAVRQVPDLTFGTVLGFKALVAALLLLPLTLVAGLGVPLLLGALASDLERVGSVVGDAYVVNTVGTIFGSLFTGFVLIGLVGTQGALRIGIGLNVAVGLWGVLMPSEGARATRRLAVVAAVAALALMVGAARWPLHVFLSEDSAHRATDGATFENRLRFVPSEVRLFKEGREATVAVVQSVRALTLLVNGHADANDNNDMSTQVFLGVIPALIHPGPQRAMVVGFGSGVTAANLLRVPEIKSIDVVELERAVLAAAPLFHHVNRRVEQDARVRLVHDDARSFVTSARGGVYDLIVSEPSNPWRAGVATLFTDDFYRSALRALKPRGIFAQWVQLYALSGSTLKLILRTFSSVFPEVQVWWLDQGNIVVVGSNEPMRIDRARADALLSREFRPELVRWAGLAEPAELYGFYLLGNADVRALLAEDADNALNHDDQPLLEFEAPRGFFHAEQNSLRLLQAKLMRRAMVPPVDGGTPPEGAIWSGLAAMYRSTESVRETRVAVERALAADPSPYHRMRAAQAAAAMNDLRAVEQRLAGVEDELAAMASQPLRDFTAGAVGGLRLWQHRPAEALAAFDRASELDGDAQVARMRALVQLHRFDDALAQIDRTLLAATPGGAIGERQLWIAYEAIGELPAEPAQAARLAELVEARAHEGFSSEPRERLLAMLYQRAGRPADVVAHARRAGASGAIDVQLDIVQLNALIALHRDDEALALRRRIARWQPNEPVEAVVSPLVGKP